MYFQISSRREIGKEIRESSRLEFLKSFQQTILLYQMQKITLLGH